MSFVGNKHQSIYVTAIGKMGDIKIISIFEVATKNNRKVLLDRYPKDFTFVCPRVEPVKNGIASDPYFLVGKTIWLHLELDLEYYR